METKEEEIKLYNFIERNHPGYEECLVCKETFTNDEGEEMSKYYIIEKHKGNNCDIYLINDRMWYDWTFKWKGSECPWEVIFKSK